MGEVLGISGQQREAVSVTLILAVGTRWADLSIFKPLISWGFYTKQYWM